MAVFRVLILLAALGVVGMTLAWVFTRRRIYLDRALLILKVTMGAALIFFGVLIFQNLAQSV